jgi:hypothetical protein
MTRGAQAAKLIRQGETALADHCVLMTGRLDEIDLNTPVQDRFPAL